MTSKKSSELPLKDLLEKMVLLEQYRTQRDKKQVEEKLNNALRLLELYRKQAEGSHGR